MSKKKISVALATVLLAVSGPAFALEKVHADPAHHGPGWLSTFAAVAGFILACASVYLIYMMVSGKAGKFSE